MKTFIQQTCEGPLPWVVISRGKEPVTWNLSNRRMHTKWQGTRAATQVAAHWKSWWSAALSLPVTLFTHLWWEKPKFGQLTSFCSQNCSGNRGFKLIWLQKFREHIITRFKNVHKKSYSWDYWASKKPRNLAFMLRNSKKNFLRNWNINAQFC